MHQNNAALLPERPNTPYKSKAVEPAGNAVRELLTLAFRQAVASSAPAAGENLPPSQASPIQLPALLTQTLWKTERIAIKANGRIFLINPADILVAEAQGNYVLLHQSNVSHQMRGQISVLASKLQDYGFIRIHRSILVNAAHVEGVEPLFTGEYLLRMKDGKEFNVTRTYKNNLHQLASTWIGSEGFISE